jgi:hypothetical protein
MTPSPEELTERVVALLKQHRGGVLRRDDADEVVFRCVFPERHQDGDVHPSASFNRRKRAWCCRVCSAKGGLQNLAGWLGLLAGDDRVQRETGRWLLREADGRLRAVHVRLEPGRNGRNKDCPWFHPDGRTPGLAGGVKPVDLPLYGCERLQDHPCAPVVLVEGEKACDALVARGILAVATVTGAGTIPADAVLRVLAGRTVTRWPDADSGGREHMRRIAARFLVLGIAHRAFDPWPERTDGADAADWTDATEAVQAALAAAPLADAPPAGERERTPGGTVWERAVPVDALLVAEDASVDWIAEPVLAPGSFTILAAPRGLGKTHVALSLAVAVATGGVWCSRRITPGRVLLIDRDNPRREVKRRLRAWGAAGLGDRLRILTRDDAPPLTDARAWAVVPFADYDVVILDSISAATEGVNESEAGATGKALAPLLDLARRGPAVLVLANTRRDGEVVRGSGALGDRADIVYELRDATDLVPDPKAATWWRTLPLAGDAAWSERAQRRRRRDDYRLALVPSKFRIGEEPDPWCLELRLADGAWEIADVTVTVEAAHEEAQGVAAADRRRVLDAAVAMLATQVQQADDTGRPLLKADAEEILRQAGLTRSVARDVLRSHAPGRWQETPGMPGLRGGTTPTVLVPPGRIDSAAECSPAGEPCGARTSEGEHSAVRAQPRRQNDPPLNDTSGTGFREGVIPPPIPPQPPRVPALEVREADDEEDVEVFG